MFRVSIGTAGGAAPGASPQPAGLGGAERGAEPEKPCSPGLRGVPDDPDRAAGASGAGGYDGRQDASWRVTEGHAKRGRGFFSREGAKPRRKAVCLKKKTSQSSGLSAVGQAPDLGTRFDALSFAASRETGFFC